MKMRKRHFLILSVISLLEMLYVLVFSLTANDCKGGCARTYKYL